MNKNIWIYCELDQGLPVKASLELLAKAGQLAAKTSGQTVAVLMGNYQQASLQILASHGADTIITVAAALNYQPRPFATALAALAEKHRPAALLLPATSQGRDLAPRVQAKLDTGLTADCLDLDMDENGLLLQTKPSYGDNIMCVITCPATRPQMATVRPGVFNPVAADETRQAQVIDEPMDIAADPDYRLLQEQPLPLSSDDISKAEVIIALGLGANSEKVVNLARQCAQKLNGVIAITRPLSDSGRFAPELVIGQSGSMVKPRFILNLGISGAIQYVLGMDKAELIVAVNIDPQAPIFAIAHYAVVDDAESFLNALLTRLDN